MTPGPLLPRQASGVLRDGAFSIGIAAGASPRATLHLVRAAKAIPHVDLVLVVDDGSEDDTQHVAREAGGHGQLAVRRQGPGAAFVGRHDCSR